MRIQPPSLLPMFRSEMQVRLLELVLLQPDREWTLGELARRLGSPTSSVHRELHRLVDAGLAVREDRVRPHAYRAATQAPAYEPLSRLLGLTIGVPRRLAEELAAVPAVRAASIHGSWAAGRVGPESDVDVLVVTEGDRRAVQKAARRVGRAVARDIDLSVLALQEFNDLAQSRNPFVVKILRGPRIDVVGDLAALQRSSDRGKGRAH